MSTTITGISSMATSRLLTELGAGFALQGAWAPAIEAVGGVDAARRVRAGEPFDVVVLAANVMETLEREGWIVPGTRAGVARSGVAIAVRAGLPHPPVATADDVRRAVLGAAKIGYSSGPSGDHLKRLFADWGIAEQIVGRILEAKPGVPVGGLVARGEADLGFQQLSELQDVPGIELLGMLPDDIQTLTVFTAGVGAHAAHPDGAGALIAHFVAPETRATKQRLGMDAAD